jgi:hypothetical protein
LKLNLFDIREDLWSIKLQVCGVVDNCALRIDWKVKDYHLCGGPLTTNTSPDMDTAKAIGKMTEHAPIIYPLCGIPMNDKCKIFIELFTKKNATMTATPNEIVPNLVETESGIIRENEHSLKAMRFAKKGGKASEAGKCGKSPCRKKRDNKGDNNRKEKHLWKCCHCQQQGHITENCLNKQCGDPPKAADTAGKASTGASATSTLTTLIKHFWTVASSNTSSCHWFIDWGCMTHISGRQSLVIIFMNHSLNTKKVKGYKLVTSFVSGYVSVRSISQPPA